MMWGVTGEWNGVEGRCGGITGEPGDGGGSRERV